MERWRPSALFGLVMTFPPLAFFALWGLRIAPTFAKALADFGGHAPALSTLVLHPAFTLGALAFLVGGLAAGLLRPRERFLILPLTASGGCVLAIFAVFAAYLPLLNAAADIQ